MRTFFLSFFLLFVGSYAGAAQDKATKPDPNLNVDKEGLALQGYDPVAYFIDKKPVMGQAALTYRYQGATYRLASEKNRQLFAKDPASYAPQYGGWCAYALGKRGDKVKINPESFKITDGKLYLFYKKRSYNALNPWNKKEEILRTQADKEWQEITGK